MTHTRERGIAPWDPLRGLEPFGGFRIGRLLDEAFGELPRTHALAAPAVDVTETEDAYQIAAEVPGVKSDDLTVELHEGVLTLRGEKKSEREETKEKARLLERTYGAFSRSFALPKDADPDRIDASFEEGVLTVRIAKQPEAKPRTVAIKS